MKYEGAMGPRMFSRWIGVVGTIWLAGVGPAIGMARAQQSADPEAMQAQQLFVRGMTKAYIDDHEAALAFYQQALNLAPHEAAILSAMATSQEAMSNMTLAVFYAEQARQFAPENVAYHHQLARLHRRDGDLDAAVQTYTALLARFPDDFEALEDLAALQADQGHTRDAIATYERLAERAGDHPGVRRQLLRLYFRLGDAEGTQRSLEALTAMEPTNPAPYRLLGQLYLQQQKQQEALRAFEQAHTVDPNDLETILALSDLYRQLDRPADADRLLGPAQDVERASVEALLARAQPLYERSTTNADDAQTATRLLERVLELEPTRAEALLMLGDLRYQRGLYDEAAGLLERALEQNPRDVQVWRLTAAAYLAAYQPGEAARIATDGLLLFPGHLPLLHLAGRSLLEARRYDEAIARLDEAQKLYEEDAPEQTAERAEVLATLGLVHAQQHAAATSDAYFEQALAVDPDNAFALSYFASSLAGRETRLDEARTMARQAVALDPQNASFLDILGWIYFKLGDYDEAKQWIGQAIDTGRGSATAYDHYGDVHAQLGDADAARRFWRQALELSPGNDAVLEKIEHR